MNSLWYSDRAEAWTLHNARKDLVDSAADTNDVCASPWLRGATILTALFAFPLVWMGGLVTSHSAGMSVPDWPNSYGYNMFALPFSQWLGNYAGGTFYEHTHRLLGTLVGLAAFIATMIVWGPSTSKTWRSMWKGSAILFAALFVLSLSISWWLRHSGKITEEQYRPLTHLFSGSAFFAVASLVMWLCRQRDAVRWRRWVVTGVLLVVIVQGLMGGFRVTEISLLLAKLHGIFGQMVFAFAAVVAVLCSKWWTLAPRMAWTLSGWLKPLTVLALMLISTQLVLGAFMRHDPKRDALTGGGAGLSIPDWPLHYGKVLPPIHEAEVAKINEHRRWDLQLPPTTLAAIWLQFSHRLTGYLTGLLVLGTAVYIGTHYRIGKLLFPATAMGLLVILQITLGVLTVLWKKPADVATFHQAGGALLLMLASVLVVRAFRLYPSAAKTAGATAASARLINPVPAVSTVATRR